MLMVTILDVAPDVEGPFEFATVLNSRHRAW